MSGTKEDWVVCEWDPQFSCRAYSSYEEYVVHQKSKGERRSSGEDQERFRTVLGERLAQVGWIEPGDSVLCLGAGYGGEVQAFADLGCPAVGIDLYPGETAKNVVEGDFHDISVDSGCFDVVFTNSLDHALDLPRMISEIARVLKPNGLLIVEAALGREEGGHVDSWDCLMWKRVSDLVAFLERSGFWLVRRVRFSLPWHGEQLCLEKIPNRESGR